MQLTFFCEPTSMPTLADSEQLRLPICMRAGCALAGAAGMAASTAVATQAVANIVRNIFILPSLGPDDRTRAGIVSENWRDVANLFYGRVPARAGYFKFPQKRWMRVQASSSALVAVA